jgi:Flp pilus assembly protein TadG
MTMQHAERLRRRDDGGATMEFSLVATMLFTVMFACFEFACLMYGQITLQNAVRTAGRYAMTGNHLPDPNHPGQNLSRTASITQVAQQAAMGLDVSNIQISSVAGGANNAGGPGDTVTISLTANLPLMTALIGQYFAHGTYTTTVSATFRNEPFPPGNSN